MITLISCFTLGLVVLPLAAQQFQPAITTGGNHSMHSPAIFNVQQNNHGFAPTLMPATRPAMSPVPSVGIIPFLNPGQTQRQPNYTYPNNRQFNNNGNNGYSYNGRYKNYGNRQYGNGYNNNRPNYGNNNYGGYNRNQTGGNPTIGGWPSGGMGTGTARGVAPVVPWWFTGRFNSALPHIRQQRPTPQYPNNNNNLGNSYQRPQYNNFNNNNNYERPRPGYPQVNPGYNNGYNRGQHQYRPAPYNGYGPSVQPRILR